MAATALAVTALSVAGTLLTREEAKEWAPVWSAHRHLRLQPQSLRARGAKAARALLAATGWMQVSCWRGGLEAYDPLAEPARKRRGTRRGMGTLHGGFQETTSTNLGQSHCLLHNLRGMPWRKTGPSYIHNLRHVYMSISNSPTSESSLGIRRVSYYTTGGYHLQENCCLFVYIILDVSISLYLTHRH